jgi:hypothetical protein
MISAEALLALERGTVYYVRTRYVDAENRVRTVEFRGTFLRAGDQNELQFSLKPAGYYLGIPKSYITELERLPFPSRPTTPEEIKDVLT